MKKDVRSTTIPTMTMTSETMPDASRRRNLIWRHNGFSGSCAMTRQFLLNLLTAETTTDETRNLAREILPKIYKLGEILKTRRPFEDGERKE